VTLTSLDDDLDDKGWLTAAFNSAQCFPEVFAAMIAGPLVWAFNGHVAAALFMGGLGALVAGLLVFRTILPPELLVRSGYEPAPM